MRGTFYAEFQNFIINDGSDQLLRNSWRFFVYWILFWAHNMIFHISNHRGSENDVLETDFMLKIEDVGPRCGEVNNMPKYIYSGGRNRWSKQKL